MIDPDGRAALDWIKNLETGKVTWYDATGNAAFIAAAISDKMLKDDKVTTTLPPNIKKNYRNLGWSFMDTRGETYSDFSKIRAEQNKYLDEVSMKLDRKAGFFFNMNDLPYSLRLTFTPDYLKSYFFGDKSSTKSTKSSGLFNSLYNIAEGEAQGLSVDFLLEKSFNVSGQTAAAISMTLLTHLEAGRGSDMSTLEKANENNRFKYNVLPLITPEVIWDIRLHKY
jgi:hypothetical protein